MAQFKTTIAGLVVWGLLLGFAANDAAAQALPGGATSLNETHENWTVNCATKDGAARCVMVQQQVFGEQRQRLLTIQLDPSAGADGVEGTLVMPFGLHLDKGVVLSVDEDPVLSEMRFLTCLPMGCVVPLALDSKALAGFRSGTAIRLLAIASDTGQDVAFSIPLAGFSSAFDRVVQLKGS